MELTNWKELISEEMEKRGESFKDVVHSTLTEKELYESFNAEVEKWRSSKCGAALHI
jgi:hypothetical protein